ncbi:MAG: hypothetical protein Q7J57_10690 [Gemmobacter sp.]|nr:hypothetical protein [Gemmobacter sp.]
MPGPIRAVVLICTKENRTMHSIIYLVGLVVVVLAVLSFVGLG